jgi:hypothetical protein
MNKKQTLIIKILEYLLPMSCKFSWMKKLLVILTLIVSLETIAQNTVPANNPALIQSSSVVVHKDPRIDVLIKKKAAINKAAKNVARTARGYRLLIINTNSRDEAIAAKTKLYTYYPDLKSYLQYQSPYFKLRAGNFKTRDEAERFRKQLGSQFPKGVFIVNDIIEIKPEKEEKEMEE